MKAYYNGNYAEYQDIKIPLSDRSIFFGDAIYDVFIGRNQKHYQFKNHYERLLNNAAFLNLKCPTAEELRKICDKLVLNCKSDYMVYIQLSRNENKRNHAYSDNSTTNLLVTSTEINVPDKLEECSVILVPDKRYSYCNIKTVNLLPAVIAAKKASNFNCDEAVFYLDDGTVTECSHSNVYMLQGNCIYTHPLNSKVLPGITRENIKAAARKTGLCFIEKPFNKKEITICDEIFISSTTKIIKRVISLDNAKTKLKNPDILSKIYSILLNDFITKTNF